MNPCEPLGLLLRHIGAGLLPADVFEVAFGAVLVAAGDALGVDGVGRLLAGLLDFAFDRGAGLADDRLALGTADVNLGALVIELGALPFIDRFAGAALVFGPAAFADAAFFAAVVRVAVFGIAIERLGVVWPRTAASTFVSGTAQGVTQVLHALQLAIEVVGVLLALLHLGELVGSFRKLLGRLVLRLLGAGLVALLLGLG